MAIKFVLVEIVLVETVLVGDPLYVTFITLKRSVLAKIIFEFKTASLAIFQFCQNGTNAPSKRLRPNCESSCVPQHHMVVFRGKSRVQPPCCHLGSSNQYCMTHFSMRLALQRDARGVCGVPYLLLYVRACGLSPKHGIAALFKALHSRIK